MGQLQLVSSVHSSNTHSKMPWSGANSSRAISVAYCRTKCNKLAVIYDNYYFHHNRNYKDGDYWCCAQRGCRVRLISSRSDVNSDEMVFARRNPSIKHGHDPNAPNLVDKEFRRAVLSKIEQMNKSGVLTAASMRAIYDETRIEAIRTGIPQSLIPAFWNIRSSMYRIKRKRQAEESMDTNDIKENEHHNRSAEEVLSVGTPSPLPPPLATSNDSEPINSVDEQTEPLCLVMEKSSNRQKTLPSSILLQTLQSSPGLSVSASSPLPAEPAASSNSNQIACVTNLMAYPAAIDTLLQYSKQLQPSSFVPSYPSAEMFQQYAAFHAEYLRSLMALNLYPRF